MMEEQSFHPLDYIGVVKRRMWWFLLPLAVCVLGGILAVLLLPKKYVSQAAIAVASPTLSPELMRGVSSMDPGERQRAISQLLLSPAVLERVVREEKINPAKPVADVASWLRTNVMENISVPNPIGLTRPDPDKGIDLFYLGYSDSDPARAQRITNRLAYVFVEENSKQQTVMAENTSELLAQQLADSQAKLNKIDDELRAKKQNFMGRLPEQTAANVQMVNGARSQFESLSMQLRTEQDHLNLVESQISQMRQGVGAEGMTSASVAQVQAAQKRIDDLETQLAQARAFNYTDKHPAVIRLQEEIKQARADLASAKQQEPNNQEALLKADPLYRAKLNERDQTKLRIDELRRASQNAQAQISTYQARVDSSPMVEQELSGLLREQQLERSRYDELTKQLSNAQLAEDTVRKQGNERFSVLYPANLPAKPESPNALKVMGLAIVAGLVLGAGAALGREFLDRSVYDARALQSEFEVPVLGEIPRITAA
ncbi:MAG TPA: Wzz/FepE/Etk N-terminal domain-containing protein [Vicinamibacterales bacterium]|jgi:polysaccharide chain length determinant protein (PEP-CTERM system associated)|nr:Wzz/FepE/Etk N-terminal domain-containing protein [Vicinamibacterales bacterium]